MKKEIKLERKKGLVIFFGTILAFALMVNFMAVGVHAAWTGVTDTGEVYPPADENEYPTEFETPGYEGPMYSEDFATTLTPEELELLKSAIPTPEPPYPSRDIRTDDIIDITTDVIMENFSRTVLLGRSGTFKYHLRDIHGIPATGKVRFSNSNPEVLELDEEGNWRAIKTGKAILPVMIELSEETMAALERKFPGASFVVQETQQLFEMKIVEIDENQLLTYRVYNPNSGEHLYTVDESEKNALQLAGWYDEDIAWLSVKVSEVPVYRVYNPNAGNHHFTTDKSEVDRLASLGWNDEGIAFYSAEEGNNPVYRVYSPNGRHLFTRDQQEREALIRSGWKDEGIAWYE